MLKKNRGWVMDKRKGFTLVELVIVIVIVGILSIVAVPIYRGYTRKAMATEGTTLLGTIMTAQKIYYTEHAHYYSVSTSTDFVEELDVDARPNKYFKGFTVTPTADAGTFTASTTAEDASGASGISLTVVAGKTIAPTWIDSGLN